MAKTKLQVVNAPSYIYVGETLGLNVQTDAASWDVSMNPVGIVNFNAARDKMTGLSKGSVQITIKAQREGYESNSVMVDLRVLEKESQTTSIMFHNRKTNRVSKLITPLTANTDIVVKMPESSSGTLVTSDNLTSTFATIVKPVIIDPKTGDVDCEGQLTATDYQTQLGYQGAHEGSIWEYATDKDFENILDTRTIIRGDKTKGPIFHTGATIWVRVKYVSYQVESEWSDPVQFTCKNYGRDSLQTVPNNGNWIDGKYFGIVPHSELIDNRDYRGHWKTLNTYNLKTFTSGMQVHQDETDTLYYALKDIAAADNIDPIISVANSDGKWAIDTRENLPTPRWVNEVTGIGMGYTDNNGDGYSSGATAVGAMVDHTLGWIKYVYKGRLCYTTKKPICTQLCWNDIGKRDIMYGERTFRGGATQMYRIRLMREDEYVAIMGGLMDGTLGAFSKVDLGLVDATDQSIGRLQWLEDFQEGAKRKVGSPDLKIFETDPKTRVGILPLDTGYTKWLMSYRPVIELVTESDEPWKNWPLGPEADNENFRYDKYTDTGYFGQVRSDMFIDGDSLAAQIGLTAGTSINSNCGWFKFWWHGLMLYISTHSYRTNYMKDNIAANIMFNFDTGNLSCPTILIGGLKYRYGLPEVTRTHPAITSGTYDKELGKYSKYNELLYRVYVESDSIQYFNTTTQPTPANIYVMHLGVQIGDNWDTFVYPELGWENNANYVTTNSHLTTNDMCNLVYYAGHELNHMWLAGVFYPNYGGVVGDNGDRATLKNIELNFLQRDIENQELYIQS